MLAPEILAIMALALGIGGTVKGATGMGLPVVALPILAAFLGVQHAVAIMCVPVLVTNLWQLWLYRAEVWTTRFLPALILGGAVGIVIGTWLIVSIPERALSLVLGLLVFVYIAVRLARPAFAISLEFGKRLAAPVGLVAGILQGATGISSPVGVTFVHSMRLHRTAHVFAVTAMFFMFSVVQVPALAIAGIFTWRAVIEGLIATVPALAMMPVGQWLASRLSQRAFDFIILSLLAFVALQLLVQNIDV
jgi:uncharacterized membrane protein YfcA